MSSFTLGSLILSKLQPNLNTTVGLDNKMILQTPPTHSTLKVGSCEHLEQIPTVTGTFVQVTFVQATSVHIRNIQALIDLIWMKL